MKKTLTQVFVTSLLLWGTHLFTQAQNRLINGRVVNENNEPLAGASVVAKNNPARGTTTAANGTFTLSVTSTMDSLLVSAVGFVSQTVAISDGVLIKLVPGRSQLDEVVVIGYGTQKRVDLTAPVTTVNTENMLKRTTATPMEALQGSVPGVQVVSTGAPGSSPNVRIRGVGSFNNESPLYVVDGMFVNDIGFLNPNDIAEMSVLKDASGAAIYGVRAANGVVLITTKKGTLNMRSRITYNGYVGFQTPAHRLKMANGKQYTAFSLGRKSVQDSGTAMLSAQKFGGSGLNPTTSTDWYDELLRSKALITNNGIDLQGGSDKVTYSAGFNYTYQNGIMDAMNNFKRYNIRLQMEARAYSWLKIGFTAHLNNSTTFNPASSAFAQAYSSSPLFPVYDSTNTNAFPVKFTAASVIGRGDDANPVATAYYNYDRAKVFQVLPTIYAEASFWKNKITLRSQLSQLYSSLSEIQYSPMRNLG
ncbi:MAG TPA: TonB-dependent receptor plug domain-containing protein, partial [Puia sp.]|nr:TonB-dependent receptor plug domain-containing protein [Puia sp.]